MNYLLVISASFVVASDGGFCVSIVGILFTKYLLYFVNFDQGLVITDQLLYPGLILALCPANERWR